MRWHNSLYHNQKLKNSYLTEFIADILVKNNLNVTDMFEKNSEFIKKLFHMNWIYEGLYLERRHGNEAELTLMIQDNRGFNKKRENEQASYKPIRVENGFINQARFGTLPLREIKFRMGTEKNATCRLCNGKSNKTTIHFLFYCKALAENRKLLLGSKTVKNRKRQVDLLANGKNVKSLCQFIIEGLVKR